MNTPSFFFYLFSLTMILASLAVVLARNPLYNVLSLVVAIFSLSSLFMLLKAFFVGIILLLVYAGAVLVFFLFVVMCLNLTSQGFTSQEQSRFRFLGGIGGVLFLGELWMALSAYLNTPRMPGQPLRGTIEAVGQILFTEYLLPFELTSLLLLIAIFGIVSLASGAFSRKEEAVERQGQ
jgi:NADH-quinone oxidoreductase subunit J